MRVVVADVKRALSNQDSAFSQCDAVVAFESAAGEDRLAVREKSQRGVLTQSLHEEMKV